ncbi:MAG: hypothetical protein RLZZ630_2208 [Bacteroidota bacterium]
MPSFRVLVPFLLGILSEDASPILSVEVGLYLFVVLILLFLSMVLSSRTVFPKRHWFGAVMTVFFFLSGAWHTSLHQVGKRPASYLNKQTPLILSGRTCATVKCGKKSSRVVMDVHQMWTGANWQEAQGKIYINAKPKVLQGDLPFGSRIMLKASPVPFNPRDTGFPSALFLRRQVLAKAWVKDTIVVLNTNDVPGVRASAMRWRARVADFFVQQYQDRRIAAVATALVVGEELPIDKELNRAYSVSGTLHILCVSGMHVGLVYVLLGFLLKRLREHVLLRHIYYPSIITLIWGYALLAGASPSVVRASVMCSILLTADWMNRKSMAYNTLAGSFFIMVIADPFQLFEPGLQLSFLAVLGIVWLSRMITAWWQPSSVVLFKGWSLLSVSLAAQVMTMPVALCYFGQFPNYFLLSNLVIVPVTTAAIYGCLFHLCVSFFSPFALLLMEVNAALIRFSNAFVLEMEHWPFVISHWSIGWMDAIFMYILIILVVRWFQTAAFPGLLRILLVLVVWSILLTIQTI